MYAAWQAFFALNLTGATDSFHPNHLPVERDNLDGHT
jgi:hypothetical protein